MILLIILLLLLGAGLLCYLLYQTLSALLFRPARLIVTLAVMIGLMCWVGNYYRPAVGGGMGVFIGIAVTVFSLILSVAEQIFPEKKECFHQPFSTLLAAGMLFFFIYGMANLAPVHSKSVATHQALPIHPNSTSVEVRRALPVVGE